MSEEGYKRMMKIISFVVEWSRLRVTYGLILATPAKEIKRMKLRQIEKELKMLKANQEEK